jgi:UDP-N-acetylglucosamine 2-epimerase (non-hydrolysing)
VRDDNIHVVGNTIIDAVLHIVENTHNLLDIVTEVLNKVGKTQMILCTAHRRENFGAPMLSIFEAVKSIVKEFVDVTVVFLVHPNPNVKVGGSFFDL